MPVKLSKGSFTAPVFNACNCGGQLRCGILENFLSLLKCNCLLQPNTPNAAPVNHP